VLRAIALTFALMVGAAVVAVAPGAALDPTLTGFTMASSLVWPTFGPHLLLVSSFALGMGLLGVRRGPRRLATVTAVVGAAALVAASMITAQVVHAAGAGGGRVNPLTGLALGSMTSPPPDRTQVFTSVDGQPLHAVIYQPAPGSAAATPVFFYVHGGGWIGGTADQNAHDLRWFADRGWLVVSVEYPLATDTRPTWQSAPAAVGCGLVWVTRNAVRLGGDAARVVVAGDSAGGNLAINLAYAAATGKAPSSCGGAVPVPDAVVVQYPVVDPRLSCDEGRPTSGVAPRDFIGDHLGGTPQQHPDRLAAITTATYLSGQAPPTLILEPEHDVLIPTAGVDRFADRARAAGVDVTVVRIPWANHAYDQWASGSLGNQARLTITQHYLSRHGLTARR
jgi:acetyl esterase/lipase